MLNEIGAAVLLITLAIAGISLIHETIRAARELSE